MGIIGRIKGLVSGESNGNEYTCTECGTTFHSHLSPDDHLLTCSECDSRSVELVERPSP